MQIHYLPPDYPAKCFPSRCEHPPQYSMIARTQIVVGKAGRKHLEIDHNVCLGCGASLPATFGGNVLVDLSVLLQSDPGSNWKIGMRIIELRDKWARIASYLFDESGWNGRHEKLARRIDPRLTMKLIVDRQAGATRVARIKFDREYLREAG